MAELRRTSATALLIFGVVGAGVGLVLQFARSARGSAPFVPPLSLSFTLLVMGGVLLALGIALRRAVSRKSGKPINPFHAVRLLAGAKAGQFAGALLAGFGAGLALQLLSRSVLPLAGTWVPMVLVFGSAVVLLVCGVVTESLCRVPPSDPGRDESGVKGAPEPDAA